MGLQHRLYQGAPGGGRCGKELNHEWTPMDTKLKRIPLANVPSPIGGERVRARGLAIRYWRSAIRLTPALSHPMGEGEHSSSLGEVEPALPIKASPSRITLAATNDEA